MFKVPSRWVMMSDFAKLTGEDLSRFKKSLLLVPDRRSVAAKCLHFLPYIMSATTAGIERNEEITSLSPYVYNS